MDIHQAMIIHAPPARVYQALTSAVDLAVWMDAAVSGCLEVDGTIIFQYEPGRSLQVQVLRLDPEALVIWKVSVPMWPGETGDQVITWTLEPFEDSTLVDLRMGGWLQDDGVLASVAHKWGVFMTRLKYSLGDRRELVTLLGSNP